MDEYGNWIYLTPMVLGGIATVLAAGWKFLGIGNPATSEGPLDRTAGRRGAYQLIWWKVISMYLQLRLPPIRVRLFRAQSFWVQIHLRRCGCGEGYG